MLNYHAKYVENYENLGNSKSKLHYVIFKIILSFPTHTNSTVTKIAILYINVIFSQVCIILLKFEELSVSIKIVFAYAIKNDNMYMLFVISV